MHACSDNFCNEDVTLRDCLVCFDKGKDIMVPMVEKVGVRCS